MFANFLLFVFFIGVAVYGAKQTVQERRHLSHLHKRRHNDH